VTVAAPLFLLATLAAVVPVILHLVNRQKAKELPFPTLRFLKISVQKTRRRRRIQDLLLMLLRAAVLVLIALGLARPAVTSLSRLLGGAQSAVVIVLDNSASMGTIDGEQMRFDTALDATRQILDELGEGDQVALMLTSGPPFPELGRLESSQDKIRQALAQCRVSYERADVGLHLQQAQRLLEASKAPNKQIFVITDMQAASWRSITAGSASPASGAVAAGDGNVPAASPASSAAGDDGASGQDGSGAQPAAAGAASGSKAAFSPEVPVIVVDCNRAPKPDVMVRSVALSSLVPIAGMPMRATVELENVSPVEQRCHVDLYVDGTKQASSPALSVPAGQRVAHQFEFVLRRGGLHKGEVRLVSEDGLKLDDRRFFAMEVNQDIPVAVVKPRRHEIPYLEDTFYLERALMPARDESWAIRITALTADDLLAEPLSNYRVIYCVNLPALGTEAARRLADYVEAGGNVVWICGDNVEPEAYNQMNQQVDGRLLPATLLDVRQPTPQEGRDSWHVSFLDKEHPALAHLVEPPSLYQSVLVYRQVRMAAEAAEAVRVLARVDDGEPLLVERPVGEGKVLLLGTSAHVGWTNLPLRPIFLPLVARLTFVLAETEQTRREVLAGAPIVLSLPDENRPVGVEILPPTGETIRSKTQPVSNGRGQRFRFADTHQVGVYVVRLIDARRPAQLAWSVNFDPEEASTQTLSHEELETLLKPAPVVFAEDPHDLSSTFKFLREGRSLWGLLLTAVLIVLVFETFVSNRFSPQTDAASQRGSQQRRSPGRLRPAVPAAG